MIDEIKKIVEDLIIKMGFECEVEAEQGEEEGSIYCNVATKESNFLIGQYGVNLESLQHIARVLVRKKFSEKINFTLDVNSYRKEKENFIIKLAREMAQEALREKRAVVMRPMTPYERRIVHIELAKNTEVATESIGEGESRKVVIKPGNLI